MLDREQLETFATVAEQQSFDRAAAALAVSRGAVSQRIKALEEALGATLLMRDKPVVPTPPGETLLRYVKMLRLMERDVLADIAPARQAGARVPIAIAVNADSLATWFAEPLRELLGHNDLALEVVADDQDHTATRIARGEVIGCISAESHAAPGLCTKPLGAMDYRCYATTEMSRQYFAQGLTLESVMQAPAVLFNRKDSLHADFLARHFGFPIDRFPRHYLPSPTTLLEGIVQGLAYGLAPTFQATPLVERGLLVDLAPEQPMRVKLYWHHWEVEPDLAARITRHVVTHARRRLIPVTDDVSPAT